MLNFRVYQRMAIVTYSLKSITAGQAQRVRRNGFRLLELEAEFWIFDTSERHAFFDEDGRLFGLLKEPNTFCDHVGTMDEQVAIFYPPNAGSPWHGHPSYPLTGVHSRSGQFGKPSKIVFTRMVEVGLLTADQAKRLRNGDHI